MLSAIPRTRLPIFIILLELISLSADTAFSQNTKKIERLPEITAIWPASPIELVISFISPIDLATAEKFVGRTISYYPENGSTKSPTLDGKKLERLGTIRIAGTSLLDEGRTLLLATDPHPLPARYALELPDKSFRSYSLNGVEVSWKSDKSPPDSPPEWTGWLALPALGLVQEYTDLTFLHAPRSQLHQRGAELFHKPGEVTIASQLILPKGKIQAELTSSTPIEELILGNESPEGKEEEDAKERKRTWEFASPGEPYFLLIRMKTAAGQDPSLTFSFKVVDAPPSAISYMDRYFLPWAPLPSSPTARPSANLTPPETQLAGGNSSQGETLFYGDQAQCGRCHRVRGKGGDVGPDLTEIGKKGITSIFRSIATPSEAIDPNYVAFTVSTRDGRVVTGIVRADGPDAILVNDTNAKSTRIARKDIEQIRPNSASIMPVGLASALGEKRVKDLIAFLLKAEAK